MPSIETMQFMLPGMSGKINCYFKKSDDSWISGKCDIIFTKGPVSFLIKEEFDWLHDQYESIMHDSIEAILIESQSGYTILKNCKLFLKEQYLDESKSIHNKYDFYYSDILQSTKSNEIGFGLNTIEKAKQMLRDFKLSEIS